MGKKFSSLTAFISSLGAYRVPPPPMKKPKEAVMNMTPGTCGDCKWFQTLFPSNKEIGECFYYPPTVEGRARITRDMFACSKFKRKGVWEN